MTENIYRTINLGRKLVKRSTAPYFSNSFVLQTDVNQFAQFDSVTATMKRAAESMPDAFFLHLKIPADNCADAVRIVPSVLNSFNRSRTLRRANISGIRICNVLNELGRHFYVSDMVVSCAFDAVAICSGVADFATLGAHIFASIPIPLHLKKGGRKSCLNFAETLINRFWSRSHLARHSVAVFCDNCVNDCILLRFEPHTLSQMSLLLSVLSAFRDAKGLSVEVGRNSRLMISRAPLWCKSDYIEYYPDRALSNYRYRKTAAFGCFFHNPDYPLY